MAATTKKNLLQRINEVQKKATYVEKEKKSGMQYSIVSHDAVTAKLRPLMVEAGIAYWPSAIELNQSGNRTEIQMVVTFANVDDQEDTIRVHSVGYGIDQQDKGPGKAISYAVKYALLKAFGLETGDDPDKDQQVIHDDPSNPDRIIINEFKERIGAIETPAALKKLAGEYKDALTAASNNGFAAEVASARSAYSQRLQVLEDTA